MRRERTIKELEEKLEATEEKLVEVVFGKQEEKVKPKSPEQVAEEVYTQFPTAPPRFVQAALRRSHPNLSEEERRQIVENLRPEQPDPLHIPLGYSRPFCDHWLPSASVHRALNTLKKRDPELVEVMLIRLRRQGWEA